MWNDIKAKLNSNTCIYILYVRAICIKLTCCYDIFQHILIVYLHCCVLHAYIVVGNVWVKPVKYSTCKTFNFQIVSLSCVHQTHRFLYKVSCTTGWNILWCLNQKLVTLVKFRTDVFWIRGTVVHKQLNVLALCTHCEVSSATVEKEKERYFPFNKFCMKVVVVIQAFLFAYYFRKSSYYVFKARWLQCFFIFIQYLLVAVITVHTVVLSSSFSSLFPMLGIMM